MRKINYVFVLLLIGAIISFTSCSDDDNNNGKNITYDELPALSKQFISDHFADYSVSDVKKESSNYDVSLIKPTTNGYEIKFDREGEWLEVEGHSESALPDNVLALLPRSIVSYVKQNYADKGINEMKKETYGYKVELTGRPDIELMFDLSGNYLGEDNDNEQIISFADLPDMAQTFVTTHFNSLTPSKVKKDGDSYDVTFTNKTEVEFDLTGLWKEVDMNGNVMPQSIVALLPQAVTNYLTDKYPSKRIEEIKSKISSYEVELEGDIDLTFDKEGNFWGSNNNGNESNNGDRIVFSALPTAIQNTLNTYFDGATAFLYAERDDNKYEVKLKNGTDIDFNLSGDLISVEVLPGNKVPDALIPSSILSYVNNNYQNKVIEEFEKKTFGYKVELSGYPEIKLLFDTNGNIKGLK